MSSDSAVTNSGVNPETRRAREEFSPVDIIGSFSGAMADAGLRTRDKIIADGKRYRVHIEGDKKGSRNGWYVLHLDGTPNGVFASWRGVPKTKWTLKGAKPLSDRERREWAVKAKQDRARRAAEEKAKFAAAARMAIDQYERSDDVVPEDFSYLARKQVKAHPGVTYLAEWVTGGGRRIPRAMIVPMWRWDAINRNFNLSSLQAIFETKVFDDDRDKDYLLGGEKGCFPVGKPRTAKDGIVTLLLGEGYATMASAYEATKIGAYVAFDRTNLADTAKMMREAYPGCRIVGTYDNDQWTDGNPGKSNMEAALQAVGEPYVIVGPEFSSLEDKPTDFNDMAVLDGQPAVRARIIGAIRQKIAETKTKEPPPADKEPEQSAADKKAIKDKQDEKLKKLNDIYAVVNEAGKAMIFREEYDKDLGRKYIIRSSFEDFKKLYQNQYVTVADGDEGKGKSTPLGDFWLKSTRRRQYLDGVVFDPTGKHLPTQWNLWQGWSVDVKAGDWSLGKDHLLNVICGGNQTHFAYLVGWLARMFQHPELQGEVAVVLRGEKGTGKGTLGKWLLNAFGQHGLHIARSTDLIGNFNGHLRDCSLIFADEAFFAGDRQGEGVLKQLITEDRMMIEAKHQNAVIVKNRTHILMASNSEWVVPATRGERRYFVLDVVDTRKGDMQYFSDLDAQMIAGGGIGAMIHELLRYDLSKFDHRTPPKTKALEDQKRQSMESHQEWLYEVLDSGIIYPSKHGAPELAEWMEHCPINLAWESYQRYCRSHRTSYPLQRPKFCSYLRKVYGERTKLSGKAVVGEIESPRGGSPVFWQLRPSGYRLGSLAAARKKFVEYEKTECDWHDAPEAKEIEIDLADFMLSNAALEGSDPRDADGIPPPLDVDDLEPVDPDGWIFNCEPIVASERPTSREIEDVSPRQA